MPVANTIREKREEILRIAAHRGARNVRLFGSVARGEESADSDVNLLVDMEEGRGFLDLSHLLLDIEELLGRRVHVVEPEAIYWATRERIIQEAVPL